MCDCECELDVQCDERTCKKDACKADECVSTCDNEIDEEKEFECCGEGCCNEDNIIYDEFGC